MRELGSGTAYNTHNTTSLIRTLKHVSDILQTEEAFTVKEYTHTHTFYYTKRSNSIQKYQLASKYIVIFHKNYCKQRFFNNGQTIHVEAGEFFENLPTKM